MSTSYDELKRKVQDLQQAGRLERVPTSSQRADWAYGNTKVENADVTREMAESAVAKKDRQALQALRDRFSERDTRRRQRFAPVDPPPQYDEGFEEITRLLDEDGGAPIDPEGGELEFGGEVWDSRARSEPGEQ